MESDTAELLEILLKLSLLDAVRVPTPSEPAEPAWERAADEFCYRIARTQEFEEPSPEVACALIPRLKCARIFRAIVESKLAQQARLGDALANERALLEALLIDLWRDSWKAEWNAGRLG